MFTPQTKGATSKSVAAPSEKTRSSATRSVFHKDNIALVHPGVMHMHNYYETDCSSANLQVSSWS